MSNGIPELDSKRLVNPVELLEKKRGLGNAEDGLLASHGIDSRDAKAKHMITCVDDLVHCLDLEQKAPVMNGTGTDTRAVLGRTSAEIAGMYGHSLVLKGQRRKFLQDEDVPDYAKRFVGMMIDYNLDAVEGQSAVYAMKGLSQSNRFTLSKHRCLSLADVIDMYSDGALSDFQERTYRILSDEIEPADRLGLVSVASSEKKKYTNAALALLKVTGSRSLKEMYMAKNIPEEAKLFMHYAEQIGCINQDDPASLQKLNGSLEIYEGPCILKMGPNVVHVKAGECVCPSNGMYIKVEAPN